MQLDPEGHPVVGGRTPLCSLQTTGVQASLPESSQEAQLSLVPNTSPESRWEGKIARLRRRVGEVQSLIDEDLGDLEEPLCALEREQELTPEQMAQMATVRARYRHLFLGYRRALDEMILPFDAPLCEQEGQNVVLLLTR